MPENHWAKRLVEWTEGQTAYLSVVFTWLLPAAWSRAVWYRQQGYHVRAGGPAVSLMPDYLREVAEVGGDVPALPRHNANATFTSRGCIRRCSFCAVPRIEGELRELAAWEPKPIVCDNNLLACSRIHFDKVIDSLKAVKGVDFNQGLDARLLTPHHLDRLRELDISVLRFAWDNIASEGVVMSAIGAALAVGFPKRRIRVYVLAGYQDTPEDAQYRCETLKKLGIRVNPQRYQPLDTLVKDPEPPAPWTEDLIGRFVGYWYKQRWLENIPFNEFRG